MYAIAILRDGPQYRKSIAQGNANYSKAKLNTYKYKLFRAYMASFKYFLRKLNHSCCFTNNKRRLDSLQLAMNRRLPPTFQHPDDSFGRNVLQQ